MFDMDIDASFNGTTSYMETVDSNLLTFSSGTSDLQFSYSAWIYNNGGGAVIMSKGAEYMFRINSANRITVTLIDSSDVGYITYTSNETIDIGALAHVVFTYDGSELASGIKIYKNAVLATEFSSGKDSYDYMRNAGGGLRVGRGFYLDWANSYWPGVINESILYSKELTASEVLSIYNGTPLGYNVVANYPLEFDTDDIGPNILNGANTDIIFPVPPWETYTGQIIRSWRWVQVREVK